MNEAFSRIHWRLAGWNLLVLGTILLGLGWAVYALLSTNLMGETDRNLALLAEGVAERLEDEDDERLHLDEEDFYSGGTFYLLVDSGGRIVSNPQRLNPAGTSLPVSTGGGPHYQDATVAGEPLRLYVRPLEARRREELALVVGQSVAPQRAVLAVLLVVLLAGGGAGLGLSLAGAWFLAGRALVPIQAAFRRQQQFAADASHELRTPLTVIHAAVDLLHNHRAEPLEDNAPLLEDLRREIARLERLVNDLLTLARSDLGEVDLATGRLSLSALADEAARLVGPLSQQAGIQLERRGDGTALVVDGDPDRLLQALLVLLDNALKHTPPGGRVTIASERSGSRGCLEVTDTGKGIAPEDLPRVFERFFRADPARSREYGGSGLGLPIARALVEAHQGQLSLRSEPGEGTTARISLPLLRDQD